MDRKIFLQKMMAFIKENYHHEDVKFTKDRIKFRKNKYLYGEIYFDYHTAYRGYIVGVCIYNKPLIDFYLKHTPPYEARFDRTDLVFMIHSFASNPYFDSPEASSIESRAILIPDEEEELEKIFSDALNHLEQNYFPIIMLFAQKDSRVLEYLKRYPEWFRYPALTALYYFEENNMTPNDPLIKGLIDFDEFLYKKKGENYYWDSPFGNNEFDQNIKQKLMLKKQ